MKKYSEYTLNEARREVKMMKVFDCQDFPEDIREYFF